MGHPPWLFQGIRTDMACMAWAEQLLLCKHFRTKALAKAGHLVQKVLNGGLIVVRCGKSRSSRIPEYGCLI